MASVRLAMYARDSSGREVSLLNEPSLVKKHFVLPYELKV
jgi:hypothetical protein